MRWAVKKRRAAVSKTLISLVAFIIVAASVTSYFVSSSIPDPVQVVYSSDCTQIGLPVSNSSSTQTFLVNGASLSLVVSPTTSGLKISGCLYNNVNMTTAFRCPFPLCEGGVGYEYWYVKQLELNLSFSSPFSAFTGRAASNYSITLSANGSPLANLFFPQNVIVYVNSQQVPLNSAQEVPSLCTTVGAYCISQNSTSLAFQFPPEHGQTATYQVLINSTVRTLP